MKIEHMPDGHVVLQFTPEEARKLDAGIAKHTGQGMPSEALNLSSTLRTAGYGIADHFRQPPHAWEPGARFPGID